jgi:hypothetical protein
VAIERTPSIEQAQKLYEAVSNRKSRLTRSLDEVVEAMKAGEAHVLVELPWGEVRDGETHDRHQVIVTRLAPGRVFFVNALHSGAPVGTVIEGLGKGPTRRVEPSGEESMGLDRFRSLFDKGGRAMLKS